MASTSPLADVQDVVDLWRPLSDDETVRVGNLIAKASAKLRKACPFDIDARMALFATSPTDPTALDPMIVADRVATIVHRFLVNQDGVASESSGMGPYSHSATYVNRYDKTGSDVRGEIRITAEDIDELRPAVPAPMPSTFAVRTPPPQILIPMGGYQGRWGDRGPGAVVAPDFYPGTGAE